jgi:hypothetical protein
MHSAFYIKKSHESRPGKSIGTCGYLMLFAEIYAELYLLAAIEYGSGKVVFVSGNGKGKGSLGKL